MVIFKKTLNKEFESLFEKKYKITISRAKKPKYITEIVYIKQVCLTNLRKLWNTEHMDNQQNQQAKLEIPQEIRNFLDGLLKDANMTALDENMREEMIKELYARLDNFITTAIIDNLPPEHLDEFIKLNEEKKPQTEIEQFLKDKMPNSQEVFSSAFSEFRDLYLGNVSLSRNAPAPNAANSSDKNSVTPEMAQNN